MTIEKDPDDTFLNTLPKFDSSPLKNDGKGR